MIAEEFVHLTHAALAIERRHVEIVSLQMKGVDNMVADHAQPVHLLLVVFLSAAAVVRHDPVLEVAEHGVRIGRDRRIDSADAADQRHERCQFAADRSTALVFVEQGIGLPDPRRGQEGFVVFQPAEHRPDHGVGHLAAAVRLGEEDRQSFDLVAIGFQIVPEVLRHGFRVLMGVAFPFGAEHGIQTVMVDSLFLVAANRVDCLDQFAAEDAGGIIDQLFPSPIAGGRRRFGAIGHGLDLACLLVNAVRIDGGQQIADDPSEFDTAGLFLDPFLLGAVELPVEPGEAAGKGTHRVCVARTHHHTHGEILERHGGLRDERLAGGLERFCDADGVNDHIVGLPADSGGRDFLEIVMVEGAGAAALHLLEIVAASHVAHEDQAFERLDVGARGDHVHGYGDARVVVVPELGEDGFRILLGLVGNLLAELVAFGEFLAHGLDDVVGVAVGLGKDKRLRDFSAAGEYLRPLVAEGADDSADLVGVDDVAIELLGA